MPRHRVHSRTRKTQTDESRNSRRPLTEDEVSEFLDSEYMTVEQVQVKIAQSSMWKFTKLHNNLQWFKSELAKLGIPPEEFRRYL